MAMVLFVILMEFCVFDKLISSRLTRPQVFLVQPEGFYFFAIEVRIWLWTDRGQAQTRHKVKAFPDVTRPLAT